MPANIWPRQRMDYLARSWRDGWSMSELAQRINERFGLALSRSAIAGKVNRMSLKTTEPRVRIAPLKARKARAKPPVAPPPAPVAPPREVVIPPAIWKDLLELGKGDCRYPYGDVAPFAFCGRPALPELPWCPYHAKLCYNRLPPQWSEK